VPIDDDHLRGSQRQRPGGFAPAVTLTLTLTERPPPEALAAGDVDDGRPDLLLVSGLRVAGQYLDVLHQNADGTFTLSSSLDTDYWPSGVLVADVDGDGRGDVVVPHFEQLRVGIYRQLPGGGLASEDEYTYATRQRRHHPLPPLRLGR
jgi:VCBS repeat protein